MRGGVFRHNLIASSMILIVLLGLAVHASMISVSIPSRRVFSGVVYAISGVPVVGAIVTAFGTNGSGYDTTDSLGEYLINEGLKTGNYIVTVIADGYLFNYTEDVFVEVGSETSGINFYLKLSGGVSGRVTDAVSGLALQNIMVSATDGVYTWQDLTDANGDYHVISNLPTGTYNVSALLPEGYITETVSGIAVTAGVEVTGIDLALEKSGIISGRVTDTFSGTGLDNAMVSAMSDDGKYVGATQANATGYYRISSGLGTGTYTVLAMYDMHFGTVPDVPVVAGEETPNVNIEIAVSTTPSGIITGKVTDTDDNPMMSVLVMAKGPGSGQAYTDKNGNYVIWRDLETGIYTVSVSVAGYLPEQVTGVSVTEGEITPNINFQLSRIPPEQSGRISGTVQGDPNPIPELQNPIAILLIVTLVTVMLIKLFNIKTRRFRPPLSEY